VQVNGQRPGSNNYTVDGIDNAESTVGNIVLYPPIDAIQEFKVQTSNQEAEFGKNPGATINVVIRGGTNDLHGNVYEFLRNDRLDARNFFDRPDSAKPPFRLNQYGATPGGPLVKNKSFAFGYYEGYKIRQAQTVATPLMRSGNLFELGRPIYDPLTYDATTNLRQRFPEDTIPDTRLNPVSLRLLEMQSPLPNRPGIGGNFVWNPKRISDSNSFGTRVDHQFSGKDNVFGRFMFRKPRQTSPWRWACATSCSRRGSRSPIVRRISTRPTRAAPWSSLPIRRPAAGRCAVWMRATLRRASASPTRLRRTW
jgi:hypothetical protein